ncbi:MAG: insulinase family protein, partial [Myxococcales bacterium]|nr:insulinase family protein [Myxococcales bacterium]
AAKATQAAAPTKPSALENLEVQVETLDNGLTVVMNPDHSVPTVAIAVYYDVGSRNEVRGRSGFAHLFEHMMFQGSANVPKGEHFRLVENRGGSMNGTTNHDRTNYFETMPSNELALALWLEADRMKSLAVTQENFENQRQVVMEERRQSYMNRPYALSSLRINELAFGDYWPYAHSTIGDMKDLENAPLSAVQEFFATYYTPKNATLSIAGDFEPKAALELVKKFFGSIPSHDVPKFVDPGVAPQTAERTESMVDPLADLPAFHIAYAIPPNRTPDHYALEMLTLVLGYGESSRLYQKLVKKLEICQDIDVATDDRRGPDLFSFWAVLADGKKAEDARKVIFEELDAIAKSGVTPRELEKAKNQIESLFVFGLQSNLSRARQLAEYQTYWGDASLLRTELAKYRSVTNDDIKRVTSKYFAPTNRTVLDVVPASAAKGGAQ